MLNVFNLLDMSEVLYLSDRSNSSVFLDSSDKCHVYDLLNVFDLLHTSGVFFISNNLLYWIRQIYLIYLIH